MEKEIEKLIDFWSSFRNKKFSAEQFHPKDQEIIKSLNRCRKSDYLTEIGDFLDCARGESGKPHFHLTPVPYLGNLRTADIFLLMLNPKLESLDFYTDRCAKFQEALRKNREQKFSDGNRSCLALDITFGWTSWFTYYEGLLNGVTTKYGRMRGLSYSRSLAKIADRLAILELVPYYSSDGSWINCQAEELKSVQHVREAARALERRARDGKALVVVRSRRWGIEDKNNIVNQSRNGLRRGTPEHIVDWLCKRE